MVCAQKGYPLVVTMAESFSVERRKLLRFLGAKVVLTPAAEKGTGMLAKAVELAERTAGSSAGNSRTKRTPTCTRARRRRRSSPTSPASALDYWVSGFGTGGTLKGVARALKQASPATRDRRRRARQRAGARQRHPAAARRRRQADSESHPRFRPHLMQGWAPDFISKLTEDAVGAGFVDEIVPVAGAEALRLARELARREGIFVGTSSGATLAAALDGRAPLEARHQHRLHAAGHRRALPVDAVVRGHRRGDDGRGARRCRARRRAVASMRLRAPAAAAASPRGRRRRCRGGASSSTSSFATSPSCCSRSSGASSAGPCASCSRELGIEYRSIDLDSVAYQADDRGGKIRAVLAERTGAPTIPQIFIGGEHVGGCTELFDAGAAARSAATARARHRP